MQNTFLHFFIFKVKYNFFIANIFGNKRFSSDEVKYGRKLSASLHVYVGLQRNINVCMFWIDYNCHSTRIPDKVYFRCPEVFGHRIHKKPAFAFYKKEFKT